MVIPGGLFEMDMVRTHVVLPAAVVVEVDRLVGKRRRSEFIAEAVERGLAAARRKAAAERIAAEAAAGSRGGPAAWDTDEDASAWVRQLRQTESPREARLQAALRGTAEADAR